MDIWNGVFAPNDLVKHRLYTGRVEEHIIVKSIELINSEKPEELVELGIGDNEYLVTIGFIGNEDEDYQYIISWDGPLEADEAKHEIADNLRSKKSSQG